VYYYISNKELTRLIFTGVGFEDLIIEPHVSDGHAVLGQRAGLVRADRRRGAQSLHRFQVLHQTVLARHSFGCQSQAHLHHRITTVHKEPTASLSR